MVTLADEMVTFVMSLLLRFTVTPPVGAGVPKVTANGTDCVGPTVTFGGRLIVPGAITVTVAVVSAMFGDELACIVVVPGVTPVTGTGMLEMPDGNVTEAGTVATPGLLEVKLMFTPSGGAGTDRLSVRFCVAVPIKLALV